jgi:hypothetical protein
LPCRAVALLSVVAFSAVGERTALAAEADSCERRDLRCWQALHVSECSQAESTLATCLVFLQRLETARRGAYSSGVVLLLGETLHGLAMKDVPPEAKGRYLERSRAAYREVVRNEPFNASGYLGLAEVAESGEERVDWLRGAVRAESRPAHMELLANALTTEIGGHTGELEGARFLEEAYTFESSDTERWRYGASAWQRYTDALGRYPSAASQRSMDNVVIRIKGDIAYPLLQRALLEPEAYLTYLAGAFATLCEKSIAAIVSLDECLAGLELAVTAAERPTSLGARRLLAQAALAGMRTVAGESLPQIAEARRQFPVWLDRLTAIRIDPVDVTADLLEARADYTADLPDRAGALVSALQLAPNRGDLRLKLGATYVDLRLWPEALEQLRAARLLLPPEEHEPVDELAETADKAYQARFLPADVAE